VYDDRYGCPDLFELVRCEGCDHLMTAPRLAESQLGDLYSTYYPRKEVVTADLVAEAKDVARPTARFRRWFEGTDNQGQYLARPGETVLDVGAGSCLSVIEAQNLGADAYGIEADPSVRRIADELGLKVHIGSLHDNPFPGVSFDLIVLNQVIEHIPEPHLALEALKPRLKPGGRVVLAFPNQNSLSRRVFGERWINWHIPFHLHHFDIAHFRRLARRMGYDVVRCRTVTPNVWTMLQLRASGHTPKRGEPSPMWTSRPALGTGATEEVQAESLPSPSAPRRRGLGLGLGLGLGRFVRVMVNWSLALGNRAIDAAGQGDSVLIVLRLQGGK
jgi:SAM-dependent methyltransferase